MESHDDYQPRDLLPQRYDVIGALRTKGIRLYMLILNQSALGLWTSYADCRSAGIGRPSKRLSELIEVHGVDIKKRRVSGSLREIEFCV